ncbi:hypothetical protein ACWGN5_17225 [Streptomyces sp. NPDC055815]
MVQAIGTDAWASVRARVARWLGRGDQQSEALELTILDQQAARGTGGPDLADYWTRRFIEHLASLSEADRWQAEAALRAVLGPPEAGGPHVHANHFHGPTAYQAGAGSSQVFHLRDPRA